MDRRTLATATILLVLAGPPLLAAELVHIPLQVRQGMSPVVYAFQIWVLILLGIGVTVLIAHQYVRWKPYRPAIHLAAVTVLFVAGLAWWLGPATVDRINEPLTAQETQLIRGAGLLLLLYLVLFLTDFLHDADDNGR